MTPGQTIFWGDVTIVKHFFLSEEECDIIENAMAESLGRTVGIDTKIERHRGTWIGRLIMASGRVKRQVGTRSEVITTLKDEVGRIRAAHKIFEIDIDDNAAKYIEGRPSAITNVEVD